MDLETTPRRYNFSNYLAGQAKEWAKFNAQHAFKTWNGYKGSFPYRFAKVHLCSTTTPKLFTTPSIITRHKSRHHFSQGELHKLRAKPRLKRCFKST
ncbi:unnamed protein product [Microthlaspi erraticum]|uniref:Uncharacterized protein n=1 Tax=Microthlaspi erraticum TaxID=1685480 RepID=A0A6D2JMZ0_9BRAS|nr:unnamed protein product [Microthlaspi erraticum]